MPIAGLVMSCAAGYPPKFFNSFTVALPLAKNRPLAGFASDIHEILAWVITALVVIHILAVIKHLRDGHKDVVKRMV